MFVLAVSLAITAVNSIGIFNPVEEIEIEEVNQSLASGISEIDSNISSDSDIADTTGGSSMFTQVFGTFKTMLTLVFLPYKYLVGIGVPVYLATPVQIIFNATFVWAVVQFVSGRSLKGLD